MVKLSLAMIVKGRIEPLRRTLRSAKEVKFDEIIIVDTGKSPEIEDLAKKAGAQYFQYEDPNRADFVAFCEEKKLGTPDHISDFGHARNFAFEKATGDYVAWLDSDDVLQRPERLRAELDLAIREGFEGLQMYYLYAKDESGNTVTEQWRERVVKNKSGSWFPYLHELYFKKGEPLPHKALGKDTCFVEHDITVGSQEEKDLRNLRILLYHLKKDGELESRMWKMLGKCFRGLGRDQDAIYAFEKHIEGSSSELDHYLAHTEISFCARRMGMADIAEGHDLRAIGIAPWFPQAWAGLASDNAMKKRYDKSLEFAEIGIAKMEDSGRTTSFSEFNPTGIKKVLYFMQYKSLFELGRHTESVKPISKLVELFPYDKGFLESKEIVEKAMDQDRVATAMALLMERVMEEGDDEKLEKLTECTPQECFDLAPFQFLLRKTPPKDRPTLAILCPGREPRFGPKSLAEGTGGSEEAVIHMAEALSRAGFYVDVFHDSLERGEMGPEEARHRWYPYNAFRRKNIYDHVVVWRHAPLLNKRFHARTNVLWLHDVPPAGQITKEIIANTDKFIVLSKFHRTCIPDVPEEKVFYSRNGIHPDWLAEPKNDPKRVIYASNPTRGLKNLLLIWPEVRKRTGAELHLFYGFTKWHKSIISMNLSEQKYMMEIRNMLDALKDQGIVEHGMVGQKELAEEFAKAGVWAYPTQFKEISCITGMKAQAMGAIPVCTNYAALEETVQFGGKIEWKEGQEYPLESFKETLISLISSPQFQELIRKEMIPWARKEFLWQDVADAWMAKLEGFEVCQKDLNSPVAETSSAPI